MTRHIVVIAAGCLILLFVWFSLKVQPMLEKGRARITVTLDGQAKEMTSDEISAEIVRLRGERDTAQHRAGELEQGRKALEAAIQQWQERALKAERQAKLPDPKGTEGGTATDPKEEEIAKALASTDWETYIRAIIQWIQADEEQRRSGKPIELDPKVYQLLAEYNVKATALAKLLGVEDYSEVVYHERVSPAFMEGWLKGMGVSVSDDQRARLGEVCVAHSRSRQNELPEVKDANKLEKLAWMAERDMNWNKDMKGLLTPEQYETYMAPMGGNPFWGRMATRRDISAETPAGAAQRVGEMWSSSFGLDAASRSTVDAIATLYVQDYQRRVQVFQARYPSNPPREEQMRLSVDLLRIQIEAERQLGQRLTLTPEQQEKVRGGTGTVLQIGWQ